MTLDTSSLDITPLVTTLVRIPFGMAYWATTITALTASLALRISHYWHCVLPWA